MSEAADLLRVDVGEVERLAGDGKVPARRVGRSWRFSCAALMDWLRASGTASGQVEPPQSTGAQAQAGSQNAPIGEAPEEREARDVFLRGQRVLLGRGEVVVDFGQFYSRTGDYVLAAAGGAVGLATVEQESFTTLLLGRVGVLHETELFAGATFHRHDVHQYLGSTASSRRRRNEFGEMQVGIRHTLLREKAGRPDIVLSVNGQVPTGDGSYAAGGGLVFIKSIDPVVLFASANYLRTLGRPSSAAAVLQPGSRVDLSMGYGLALNDTLAISMGVSGVLTGKTTVGDASSRQPGRFVGRVGLTSWLARGLYIEPSVSFGFTGPGRSFAVGVSVPYAF